MNVERCPNWMRAMKRCRLVAAGSIAALCAAVQPAQAQTIIDEWASVKPPPAPELKAVKVEQKETALLVVDILKQNCPPRPRCVAALPRVQRLLEGARQADVPVIYAFFTGAALADTLPEVAPRGGEPSVSTGPDKFIGTDLDKILKDKAIKTVIIVGAAAEGAVLHTAAGAALRGYRVIVPVDGVASSSAFAEQYTAWHLGNAPRIGPQVTLTKIDHVAF